MCGIARDKEDVESIVGQYNSKGILALAAAMFRNNSLQFLTISSTLCAVIIKLQARLVRRERATQIGHSARRDESVQSNRVGIESVDEYWSIVFVQ